jgi:5-methylcytosine-specific restriction endonuclease McrA
MDAIPGVDHALMEAKERERQTARVERIEQEKLARHLRYEEYLRNSPNWQRLRAAVLERDGHVCQGCLEEQPTEVHHMTYEHIYEELAYELVSVCRGCHERAHGLYQEQVTGTLQ